MLSISLLENLWGEYGQAGVFIEKKKQPSVPAPETPNNMNMPYNINDMATYFTLLVGIYFPSVTGGLRSVYLNTTLVYQYQ